MTSEGITGPLYAYKPLGKLSGKGASRLTHSYSRPVSPEKLTVKPCFKRADIGSRLFLMTAARFHGATEKAPLAAP